MADHTSSHGMAGEPEWWELQVVAPHRWGSRADVAERERQRLYELWERVETKDARFRRIVDQVVLAHICDWRMEDSILDLCAAIGRGQPLERVDRDAEILEENERWPQAFRYGCMAGVTRERWAKAWAYYLALRNWSSRARTSSFSAMAGYVDPKGRIKGRVHDLLGDFNLLKQLYVERLALHFEFERWIDGYTAPDSYLLRGHEAATEAIEEEIRKRESDPRILAAISKHNGRLFLCNHKAFRRYDIILSSIGCNEWRGKIPERGDDGVARSARLDSALKQINAWLVQAHNSESTEAVDDVIQSHLGIPNAEKVFLASLLICVLRADQQNALNIAHKGRAGQSGKGE